MGGTYIMVDDPENPGHKKRQYLDAEGNPVDDPAGATDNGDEPEPPPSPEEAAAEAEARRKEDAEARAQAIEEDEAKRKEWAEGGGDRLGEPPDPSVNASLDEAVAQTEPLTAEPVEDEVNEDAPKPL